MLIILEFDSKRLFLGRRLIVHHGRAACCHPTEVIGLESHILHVGVHHRVTLHFYFQILIINSFFISVTFRRRHQLVSFLHLICNCWYFLTGCSQKSTFLDCFALQSHTQVCLLAFFASKHKIQFQ